MTDTLLASEQHSELDPQWSFLTNHARVLVCVAEQPNLALRHIAIRVGVGERTVWKIVADLTEAGYLATERDGRRNRYTVQTNLPFHDSPSRQRTVGEVLDLLAASRAPAGDRRQPGRDRRAASRDGGPV